MEKNKNNFFIWLIPLIILLFFVLWNIEWCNILFVCNCYDESDVTFYYQFLSVNGTGLWMGVEHNKCDLMPCGHIDKCYRENYTYWFANDIKEYPNLTRGDKLVTHWCYIPKIDDYRIRGIKKE